MLLPVRSVGVMGDERTYDYTIALRIVESQDGMTADWVKLPYESARETFHAASSTKSKASTASASTSRSKPPATIEWE